MNEPERTPHHLDEEEARPRHANRSPWRATDLIAHHTRPGAAATKKDDPKKDAPERRARRPRARGLVSGARNAARPPGLRRVITNRLTRGDGKVSRLVGTVRRLRARWRTVRRVATVLATLGPPVLLPLALVLLLLLMLLAAGAADQRTATQPSETSDAEVAKYLPEGWHDVLTRAADTTRNGPAFAAVPWTLLGGVVQAQTDYGRYSPYDDIDRDPGRATPVVGPATGTNAPATSGTVTVGNVVGAGPEPVGGVSGPGRAASLSPDHPAPPRGNLSEQLGWFLHALRLRESSDRYDAGHPEGSDACGAYQYLSSTWAGYQGYATACDAPPSVQDRRKIEDTLARWNQGYTWQEIIIDHIYPAWAKSPSLWHQCPAYNCAINPPLWSYVDDIIGYMHDAAEAHPPGGTAPAVRTSPAAHRVPAVPAGGRADCQVANPDPAIGGEGDQGTGPYLLTPAAASEMRAQGADPGNPCHSSEYVAKRLAAAASDVHTDPSSPRWVPNGGDTDKENARKYWSKVIETSGIFVNRSATPGEPCAPPPDAPDRPYSISFKILYIWRCETSRMTDLYVVTMTGATPHTVESDRHAAAELLVQEALSVSYGASRWKTAGCDEGSGKPQGIFPMTKEEAAKAGVRRRCDVAENIAGAARLVLSVERVKPEQRATELGRFQPMVGGWQNLGIALGDDLEHFSRSGPGQTFTASDDCVRAMTRFLTAVAPLASDFAALRSPPSTADLDMWGERLLRLRNDNGIADPANAPACVTGSWAPGFNAILAQLTADLAGRETEQAANLNGLGNYYQALERALEADEPVPGRDSLVAPRLATRPLKRVAAPLAPDAAQVWSELSSGQEGSVPLSRLAVEYAWFLGGVIAPFDSAGEPIGSLKDGSPATTTGAPGTTQQTIGPDGCPKDAPADTLREGSDKIGIHRLCVDSVQRAPTPQAAIAVKWALSHLGWPYSQARRNEDGYADCSSFVSRAYRDSGAIPGLYTGNAPITDTFRAVPWARQITLAAGQPGDLVEPGPGHVAMLLADGYMVHTNNFGDVSKVERAYATAYWVGRIIPENA